MSDKIFKQAKEIKDLWQDPSEERLLALTKGNLLGIGSKRCALLKDERTVGKIAWREKGVFDNQIELAVWNWAPSDLKMLLAPSFNIEEGVLWQARCWPISPSKRTRTVSTELAGWGISDSSVNLGLLDERVVCYDYAFIAPYLFEEIRESLAKNEQKMTF